MLRRFQSDYRPERFELRENFRSIGRLVQSSNHLIRAGDGEVDSRPEDGRTAGFR